MMRKGTVGLVAAFASFAMIGCSDDASEAPLTEEELAALCGDSVCHELETAESCPSDCQSVCGDDFCTHDESPWDCPSDCKPTYVDVRFNFLLVGPVKADGCQWDGLSCNEPQEKSILEALSGLGNGTIATIVTLYNSGAFNALNKPDPRGRIEHQTQFIEFLASQDQFMGPMGTMSVFRSIPFENSMLFSVYLEDEDLSNHDLIWTGSLRFSEFEDAFLSQNDFWIDLRDVSQKQLMGINVTVTPAQEMTEFPTPL